MSEWVGLIGNLGFPAIVTFYLLSRFERKVENLEKVITILSENIRATRN